MSDMAPIRLQTIAKWRRWLDSDDPEIRKLFKDEILAYMQLDKVFNTNSVYTILKQYFPKEFEDLKKLFILL